MSAEVEPYPAGTMLRVTETHDVDGDPVSKGHEFEVEDYWEGGDPDEGFIAYPFYYGNSNGGYNNVTVAADKVELVMSVEAASRRRIPTAAEIIAALDCMDDYDGFRVDAADAPDGSSREISGRTDDGLLFACTITVSDVYQADF